MSRSVASIGLMSAVLLSGGCRLGPPVRSYSPLGQVTRVEVKTGPSGDHVRVIDDPAEVGRIVEFVNGHRGGWGGSSDWLGVPVPQVSAYFYSGSEFRGHFGVGPGFFECQREGDFSSKRCAGAEARQFLDLVGLPGHEVGR